MPKMLDAGIAEGHAAREPMPGFVPLKGLPQFLKCIHPQPTHTLAGLTSITRQS
jgi:hypothetical protein